MYQYFNRTCTFFLLLLVCFVSCKNKKAEQVSEKIVKAADINDAISLYIANVFSDDNTKKQKLNDSISLSCYNVLGSYYKQNEYKPIWSNKKIWTKQARSLIVYLDKAILQGLYKEDYTYTKLKNIHSILENDSLNKATQIMWGNAELMMTDALVGILNDLKQGRLLPDSIAWKNDTSKYKNFFATNINKIKDGEVLDSVLEKVQPQHKGYKELKSGIKFFVDSMDNRSYTYVDFPYKDSLVFIKSLRKRLGESGVILELNADSFALVTAIKNYQKKTGLTVDGKIGTSIIKKMNTSDKQKLNFIAITLDKYKLLPEKMPSKYIWINLPSYFLKVWDTDTLALESRIICGKQSTSTPMITSAISDIVLYPTWTVPSSIIAKEMLPGLKRNPNYLARKGLYLLDGKGGRVNPSSINWFKYNKGIPYRIQQGSGDGNALGIIKFNFSNPFAVYLHDTNQRYLFKNGMRSLSHGCVRVQEWQKLADYLVRNDSINLKKSDTLRYNTDSLRNWLTLKSNRTLLLKNKVPLFIRYFSCELVNGSIKFYDDIYNQDRDLKQKYFAKK